MPIISIIVPVYNSEKYLCHCIDSILNQTFSDFELLLIDDGSTDGSGIICDEYAKKDSRIRVFHKNNGGVSSARNMGLDKAVGVWITFVDADDWIKPYYLECMIIQTDSDLVMSSFEIIDNTEIWENNIENCIYHKENIKEFISQYIETATLCSPWCKLFKKELIGALRFNTNISFQEDTIFVLNYLCHTSLVKSVEYYGYQYRRGINESLSVKRYPIDRYIQIIKEYTKAFKAMENRFDFDGEFIRIANYCSLFGRCLTALQQSQTSLKNRFKDLINILKDDRVMEMLTYKDRRLKGVRRRFFDFLALNKLYLTLFIYIVNYKGKIY